MRKLSLTESETAESLTESETAESLTAESETAESDTAESETAESLTAGLYPSGPQEESWSRTRSRPPAGSSVQQ